MSIVKIKKIFRANLNINRISGLAYFTIIGVGLLIGIIEALYLSSYNGSVPVNILNFIFLFIVFPFIIAFTAILVLFFYRRKSNQTANILKYAHYFSIFGVFYCLGAIAALVYRVSFFDVIFGWTTTLEISTDLVYKAVSVIAWPFSFLQDSLKPSYDLVDKSQYFRINGKGQFFLERIKSLDELKSLGSWWKFLIMSIFVYGVLPRFIYVLIHQTNKHFKKKATLKTPTSTQEPLQEQYYLEYDNKDLKSLFIFKTHEKPIYFSILYFMIKDEIHAEFNPEFKKIKEAWFNEWQENIYLMTPDTSKDEIIIKDYKKLIQILVKNKKSPKLYKVLADAALFTPYYPLNEQQKKSKIKQIHSNFMRQQILQISNDCDLKQKQLLKFFKKFNKLQTKENTKKWTKLALAATASGTVVFFSGGILAPAIAAKLGGVLGIAAITAKHGIVTLLGMGVLTVGTSGAVLLGGGLLGGLNEQIITTELLKDKTVLTRELHKLLALIEVRFFDVDYFLENKRLYLKFLVDHISQLKINEKNKNKLLKSISENINN